MNYKYKIAFLAKKPKTIDHDWILGKDNPNSDKWSKDFIQAVSHIKGNEGKYEDSQSIRVENLYSTRNSSSDKDILEYDEEYNIGLAMGWQFWYSPSLDLCVCVGDYKYDGLDLKESKEDIEKIKQFFEQHGNIGRAVSYEEIGIEI